LGTDLHDALFGREFSVPTGIFGEVPAAESTPELASPTVPLETRLSLAGLAAIARSRDEVVIPDRRREFLASDILDILEAHETPPIDPSDTPRFASDQETVRDLTVNIVSYWDTLIVRRGWPSLFSTDILLPKWRRWTGLKVTDLEVEDLFESIVTETAAAVRTVEQEYCYKYPPTMPDRKDLVKHIATFGPDFIVGWLDGSYITELMERQGLGKDQQARWLKTLDQSTLKWLLRGNHEPVERLASFVSNLEGFTDEALAERIRLSPETIHEEFLPGLRKYLALRYPDNPWAPVEAAIKNLEVLTDANIMRVSGLSQEQARNSYPLSARLRIGALAKDPLGVVAKKHSAPRDRRPDPQV
jgi:hypothetical protein